MDLNGSKCCLMVLKIHVGRLWWEVLPGSGYFFLPWNLRTRRCWRPGLDSWTDGQGRRVKQSRRESWGSREQSAKPQRTPRRQKLSLESSPRAKSSLCIWAPASNEWYLFDPLNYVVPEENKIVCCDWVDLMLKPEVMDGWRSEQRAANLMIIDRRQPLYGRSLVTSTLVVLIELQDVVFHPATMLQHYSA